MGIHRTASRSRQRGLSFIGVIVIGLLAVAAFAVGGQSIPIFLEVQAVHKALKKAAAEGTTVAEVQKIFDRAAQIDDIHSVQGKDLEITKQGDKVVVGAKYSREIALAGPAFLVYRFDIQSN